MRVHLTESMINGVIDKRENFLRRLMDVQGLSSARVVRSPKVINQFGEGLTQEAPVDELERRVIDEGRTAYEVVEVDGDTIFRGTIPFTATAKGSPNCLECHQVPEGTVLGAVTLSMSIGNLKYKALMIIAGIVGTVAVFAAISLVLVRRVIKPITQTAVDVEHVVQKALAGDFKARVTQSSNDELGKIATDLNGLLTFLDNGLHQIGDNVARLTKRSPKAGENLLDATIDMVSGLTRAAHFKQAIEEDETKEEIYERLSRVLGNELDIHEYSIYEMHSNKTQILPLIVDGEKDAACRWCDMQITVRAEACRARRTGHTVNGIENPDICYSFRPKDGPGSRRHVCIPVIQSGGVGNVLQLVTHGGNEADIIEKLPLINVYLRETAPVLESKRLMATLKESSLRDPMTGLNNRRFLEEYMDTLVANAERHKAGLTIMMLDLDHFKMVNDTYGHDAGDVVIKELAKALRQSVRANDLVIRFGGEEFLIVLVDTRVEAAIPVAEKIRTTVEAMEVITPTAKLKKTISIGVAGFPEDSGTFWQALKFADVALYQAKEKGRNQVVRFEPSMWTDNTSY
ncbi:MAG: diguanylate cyclase [Magnetospirillum sp. WYHS-4]